MPITTMSAEIAARLGAPCTIPDRKLAVSTSRLGIEIFHEQLNTGSGYVLGAVMSLAVLGADVVMLSLWALPTMIAEELARLRRRTRPGGDLAAPWVPVDPAR